MTTPDWLNEALSPFKAGQAQARLLVNDIPTSTVLSWDHSAMTVRNLEDLPHVRLHPDGQLEISKDAVEWRRTDDEMAAGLQIYRILDPLTVLPRAEFGRVAERGIFTIKEGKYSVNELNLPNNIVEFFEKHGDSKRWIRISQFDEMLVEVAQKDFPPFLDIVSIVFSPYFLHRRFWNLP